MSSPGGTAMPFNNLDNCQDLIHVNSGTEMPLTTLITAEI